jgi:sulfur carrier protein
MRGETPDQGLRLGPIAWLPIARATRARINSLDFRAAMIALIINGEPRRFEVNLTVSELIERLELAGKRVALERNGEIVPRGNFGSERLADGDRLEIVVAVGGG